jgi:hypothetical protein
MELLPARKTTSFASYANGQSRAGVIFTEPPASSILPLDLGSLVFCDTFFDRSRAAEDLLQLATDSFHARDLIEDYSHREPLIAAAC